MATATRVRLRFLIANSKVIRPGFWLGAPGTDSAAPEGFLDDIAAAARAEVASSGLMAGFTNAVEFQEAEAQNFTRTGAGTEEDPFTWTANTITYESAGADIPGTEASPGALPPQSAVVWSIKSGVPGPKGRNRWFGPPLGEDDVDSSGVIDSTRSAQLLADLADTAAAAAAAGGGGIDLVVASAVHNALHAVVTTSINPRVRNQRKRASA